MAELGRVRWTHLFRARWVRRVESVARVIAVMSLIAAFDIALPDFHRSISRSDAASVAATGLLVRLDAASTASYGGSGTTWTDLSGNTKTGTITTASLNSGSSSTPRSLATGGGKYVTVASGFSDFSGGMTIQATVDMGTADNWERIMDFAADYNGGGFVAGDGDSSHNILFARAGTTNNLSLQFYAARGASPGFLGECLANNVITSGFHNYAVTVNPTGGAPTCVVYVDGSAVTSSSSLTRMPDNVTRTANFLAHSNWTADTDLAGSYKSFLMYGRALSSSEISTNWTADRQPTSPSAPSIGAVTQTSIGLSWTAPNSAGMSSITDYVVEYSTDNSTWNTFADGTSTTTSATVTGLAAGTTYDFRVSASNSAGAGPTSGSTSRATNAAYVATFDSMGGSAVSSATWTQGSTVTLAGAPTRPGYTFAGWSTANSGSTLVYQTTTPSRSGNSIVYTTGYGKGAGDAAATLTNQGVTFSRVRYRMEANYSGTLRYADVTFDKWAGATISSLAIPDLADARTIKTNVSNMTVDSNWPGFAGAASAVTTGTGKSGRLELWPWDYTTGTTGITPAGDTNNYDSDDTSAGSAAYGSFQVHNLTDSQTVLAWNHHGVADVDLGFGNNLATTHTDWTFRGRTNFDSATWKLQIYIGDKYTAGATFTPAVNADTTFYAQWTPNVNTVTYNSQGGSSAGTASWTTATSLTLPAAPTRTGYTFAGWYDASSNGTRVGSAGASYSPANTSDFTLYAQWTANSLTVTYNGQGGSSIANGSTVSGGSIASSPGTPTRANYDFKGWYASSSGGSAITFPYTHGQLADFALYAQWITNQTALSITNAPASLAYSGTVTVGTTGGSGTGGVSFATSTPGVCSVNSASGLVSMLAASGTCSLSATKAADANYYSVTGNVDIAAAPASQSALSVTGSNSGAFGGTIALSASGGTTGGTVTWSAGSSTACSVNSSGSVSITSGTGTCGVSATMAGNANYNPVTSASFTITVSKVAQSTLTVSGTSVTYGSTLTLATAGGSGTGSVTWQVMLGTCTISSGTLTPGDAGSACQVRATKAQDNNYLSATSVTTTITINKANQTGLNITSATSFTTGGSLTLTATGGQSGGSLTWLLTSGLCTLSGTTLTSPSRGGVSCTVEVTRAGDGNYNATTDSVAVTVNKVVQTLTFRTTAPTPANPGGTYTVSVDSDAFLAPVVSIANSSGSVCSISAGIVTFNTVGTCLVSATQVGSDTVSPASASQSITVTPVAAAAPASTLPAVTVPTVPVTTPPTSSSVVTETTVALKSASVVTTTTAAPVVTTTTTTTTIPADPTRPQTDASGNYPELEAGDATATVRGVAVKADVKHVDGTLVITLPNKVRVVFGASAKGSKSVGIGADGVLRMYRKDIVDVTASGLTPGTTYTVFMFSTPVELGRGEVNADGSVRASLAMPHDAEFGGHTVQINGVGPNNEIVTTQLGIEVLKKKRSTTTMVLVLLAAMALAMLSGRPVLSRRRRRA